MLEPLIFTCKLVNEQGEEVAGLESNGDFHWESVNLFAALAPINGTINTPVGWTTPELIKALNATAAAMLLCWLLAKERYGTFLFNFASASNWLVVIGLAIVNDATISVHLPGFLLLNWEILNS